MILCVSYFLLSIVTAIQYGQPYYAYDDFGGYLGRFSCPSALSTIQMSKDQRLFVDLTMEPKCGRFADGVLWKREHFLKMAMKSHANMIRAVSSLILHSNLCESEQQRIKLEDMLDRLTEDSDLFSGYFEGNMASNYVLFIGDSLTKEDPLGQLTGIMTSTQMRPPEYAIWARVFLLLSLSDTHDYGQVLTGLRDILFMRNGVNPTPDIVALISKIYFQSVHFEQKSVALLEHALELRENRFLDLLLSAATLLELTFDRGAFAAEILLGSLYALRPSISALFPPFTPPKESPFLLHAPLVEAYGLEIQGIEPKSVALTWGHRSFMAYLEGPSLQLVTNHAVSVFQLRHNPGESWSVRKYIVSACEDNPGAHDTPSFEATAASGEDKGDCRGIHNLESNDLVVFVDSLDVTEDDIQSIVLHRRSYKETALLLQASLESISPTHHVMLLI